MPNEMLGEHYRILEEIGRGGQGIILKAECVRDVDCVRTGDVVAIKVLQYTGEDETTHSDFESRAKALCSLEQDNIVNYLTYFTNRTAFAESRCLVLEYLSGRTLQDWITEYRDGLPWEEASQIIDSVLAALIYAQAEGLTHRDIKPSNIFITDSGHVKLLDFDIAKQHDGNKTITSAWQGAFDYRAPDYVNIPGFKGDQISDIFSVGVCLYEALCGCLPFPSLSDDGADIAYMQRWQDGTSVRADLTKGPLKVLTLNIRDVVEQSLNPDRGVRYSTFSDLQRSLKEVGFYVIQGAERQYEMRCFVAKGGFGEVFEAVDRDTHHRVAVKHLFASAHNRRFLREARILAKQEHPHIVRYVEFVEQEVAPRQTELFLVMEYLPGMPGSSLRDRIRSTPGGLSVEEVIILFDGYLAALQHLHEQSIFHRDMKPGNLYAPEAEPSAGRILDLGIARDAKATLTVGNVPGTLDYMAPEFGLPRRGERGSARTDLYALGLCMYEALAGWPVFPRLPSEPAEAFRAFVKRCTSRDDGDIDYTHPVFAWHPELKGILAKLLDRRPNQRFLSAAHVRSTLRDASGVGGDALAAHTSDEAETLATQPSRDPEPAEDPATRFETLGTLLGDETEINEAIERSVTMRRNRIAVRCAATVGMIALLSAVCWLASTRVPPRYAEFRQRRGIEDARVAIDDHKVLLAAEKLSTIRKAAENWRAREGNNSAWEVIREDTSALGAQIPQRMLGTFKDAVDRGDIDRAEGIQEEWGHLAKYCSLMGISLERHSGVAEFMDAGSIKAGVPEELSLDNISVAGDALSRVDALLARVDGDNRDAKQVLLDIQALLNERTIHLIEERHDVVLDKRNPKAVREGALEDLQQLAGLNVVTRVSPLYQNKLVSARRALERDGEDSELLKKMISDLEGHTGVLKDARRNTVEWKALERSLEVALTKLQFYQQRFGHTIPWKAMADEAATTLNLLMQRDGLVDERAQRLEAAEILLNRALDDGVIEIEEYEKINKGLTEEKNVFLVNVVNSSAQTLEISFLQNKLKEDDKHYLRSGESHAYALSKVGSDSLVYTTSGGFFESGKLDLTCVSGSGRQIEISNLVPKPVTVNIVGALSELVPPVSVEYSRAETTRVWSRCGRTARIPPGAYVFRFSRPDHAVDADRDEVSHVIDPGTRTVSLEAPEEKDWKPSPALVYLEKLKKALEDGSSVTTDLIPKDAPRFEYSAYKAEYNQLVDRIRRSKEYALIPIINKNNRAIKALLEWCYQYDLASERSRVNSPVPSGIAVVSLNVTGDSKYSLHNDRFRAYLKYRDLLIDDKHDNNKGPLHPSLGGLCTELRRIADASTGNLRSQCIVEREILCMQIGAPTADFNVLTREQFRELARFDVHYAYRTSTIGRKHLGTGTRNPFNYLVRLGVLEGSALNEYDLLLAFDLAMSCCWDWVSAHGRRSTSREGVESDSKARDALGVLNKFLATASDETMARLARAMSGDVFSDSFNKTIPKCDGKTFFAILKEETDRYRFDALSAFIEALPH